VVKPLVKKQALLIFSQVKKKCVYLKDRIAKITLYLLHVFIEQVVCLFFNFYSLLIT